MFETVKEILTEELVIDEKLITEDAKLVDDLGINSLELADLVMICEDRFNIEIEDSDLRNFICIKDVVDYLERVTE